MSTKMAVHFSSATDDWATPQKLFDELNAKYGPFELDPCCSHENAKCGLLYTQEDNGLLQPWAGGTFGVRRVFMNPPYGRTIGLWVKKAYEESQKGCLVACLLPARTDTKWFHDYCAKGEITFLKGRVKFGNAKTGAPFPSMVVVFRPKS
jgi:phage N-6-adenine-methyltransferase